jgi:hypothetical protein
MAALCIVAACCREHQDDLAATTRIGVIAGRAHLHAETGVKRRRQRLEVVCATAGDGQLEREVVVRQPRRASC